jgi:hypothetical protein
LKAYPNNSLYLPSKLFASKNEAASVGGLVHFKLMSLVVQVFSRRAQQSNHGL